MSHVNRNRLNYFKADMSGFYLKKMKTAFII